MEIIRVCQKKLRRQLDGRNVRCPINMPQVQYLATLLDDDDCWHKELSCNLKKTQLQ